MARASEEEVKAIIDTTLTAEQVTPFLTAADVVVTNNLTGEEYSIETLAEITRWLAAHFIAARDPRVASEGTGDAKATYEGKTAMGLNGTTYGQRVMLLDHHGKLAEVSAAKRPATIKVIDV